MELQNLVAEGVQLAVHRWTALNLAIENQWGQTDKRTELISDLTEKINNFDVDQDFLSGILDDFMYNNYNVVLEDNSHESLALALVSLYQELLAGKTDLLQHLRDTSVTNTTSCKRGEAEPPSEEAELHLQLSTMGMWNEEEVKDEPIDAAMVEDGFHMVTRSRAKRS